jgi:cbb3-type cytochrome oxidase maturation protein
MEAMIFLIPLAVLMGVGFVFAFIWATRNGQYDDMETPASRMLFDENKNISLKHKSKTKSEEQNV